MKKPRTDVKSVRGELRAKEQSVRESIKTQTDEKRFNDCRCSLENGMS